MKISRWIKETPEVTWWFLLWSIVGTGIITAAIVGGLSRIPKIGEPCNPGQVARTGDGILLSCQDGVRWKRAD